MRRCPSFAISMSCVLCEVMTTYPYRLWKIAGLGRNEKGRILFCLLLGVQPHEPHLEPHVGSICVCGDTKCVCFCIGRLIVRPMSLSHLCYPTSHDLCPTLNPSRLDCRTADICLALFNEVFGRFYKFFFQNGHFWCIW